MVSNDDDRILAQEQIKKNRPGTTWFQMMMKGTWPHSNFKKIDGQMVSNDDDSNLDPQQL